MSKDRPPIWGLCDVCMRSVRDPNHPNDHVIVWNQVRYPAEPKQQ